MDTTLLSIVKDGSVPIAQQIVDLVLANVQAGTLAPGSRLPTERSLAQQLGVARGTVKAAYNALAGRGLLYTRQGSGSYLSAQVLNLAGPARTAAAPLVARGGQKAGFLHLAVISDSPELLADIKAQLATFKGAEASIFLLDSVTQNPGTENLLADFHLILAPDTLYGPVAAALPGLAHRLVRVAVRPATETLVGITALPRSCRVGIICRSNVFLGVIKRTLLRFGFLEGNIQSFFEMDYTTKTYFPGGIDLLLSFAGAHIFTNPAFKFRNEEFYAKGGVILPFCHAMDAGSLYHLAERMADPSGNFLKLDVLD